MAETPEAVAEAVRQRTLAAVARFREELQHIESLISPPRRAPVPTAGLGSGAPAGARRLMRIGEPTVSIQAPPVPVPGEGASLETYLYYLTKYGMKQRSYDETDDAIPPVAISQTPDYYDAGVFWDAWIITPTIDSLVSFKGAPTQNTPVLPAGQAMNFQIRARVVHYQAAPGVVGTGQLFVRVARYVDQPESGPPPKG